MVVAQCQVGLAGGLVHPPTQDLEQQLGGLFAVLAGQHLQPLERGGLQRVEPVALEDVADCGQRRPAATQVVGEEVPRAGGCC